MNSKKTAAKDMPVARYANMIGWRRQGRNGQNTAGVFEGLQPGYRAMSSSNYIVEKHPMLKAEDLVPLENAPRCLVLAEVRDLMERVIDPTNPTDTDRFYSARRIYNSMLEKPRKQHHQMAIDFLRKERALYQDYLAPWLTVRPKRQMDIVGLIRPGWTSLYPSWVTRELFQIENDYRKRRIPTNG